MVQYSDVATANFKNCEILIVGDLILDTFVYGHVSRISPEAPVPVLSIKSEESMLGGCGNVAANVAALGSRAKLLTVVGDDEAGEKCRRILADTPRIEALLVTDKSRRTTLKERYVAQSQQILRADSEDVRAVSVQVEDALIREFEAALSSAHVVAISDYGKGVLTDRVLSECIRIARQKGIPVVVDPKRKDFEAYKGAAVIKPNCSELIASTGLPCGTDAEVETAARVWADRLGASIFVTRSELGMSLVRPSELIVHSRAVAREVFDVSGAGDTALSVFATAIAAGLDAVQAMKLSNAGANIVVGKRGTATVSAEELAAVLFELAGSEAADCLA
ncbi:D-glycero-beta-D-manno-heptose-7-phosphate kinase [Paraburkholderia sp. D1E]|uniref:D-glycero-beta-D-manno-heptose-7-phosphate kinase n=1 Tax=Paraburkholderia sp. D1E TaxID=3461398 RepID=UPI0040452ACD